MLNFLAHRIAQIVPTLFFVSVLIFSLQQLLPGDPALVMAGEERDPAVIEQIRQQYKLDQPIPVQYVYWLKGVLSGNFGESLRNKMPVRELIAQKLPVTLQLGSMAILIAFLAGHHQRRIAGEQLLERKDQHRHEEQCRHDLRDAVGEELQHGPTCVPGDAAIT